VLPKTSRQNPGSRRAIIYAVLVHALVIGIAVIGFRWSVQSPSGGKVIQAKALSSVPVPDKKNDAESEARRKAEKKREEELKKQHAEELKQQQLLAERKKKEAAEKEKKRKAEAERQKEEKQRQKISEQSLQEQLAAEESARQQAAAAARAASVVDQYRSRIRQQVSRSWNRPLNVPKGLQCNVKVRLAPGGEVLAVTIVRSSGNTVFDRSVENAVYKAAPLPLPEDPSLFDNFREIEFLFNPEA